jgi:hypothetical protein
MQPVRQPTKTEEGMTFRDIEGRFIRSNIMTITEPWAYRATPASTKYHGIIKTFPSLIFNDTQTDNTNASQSIAIYQYILTFNTKLDPADTTVQMQLLYISSNTYTPRSSASVTLHVTLTPYTMIHKTQYTIIPKAIEIESSAAVFPFPMRLY